MLRLQVMVPSQSAPPPGYPAQQQQHQYGVQSQATGWQAQPQQQGSDGMTQQQYHGQQQPQYGQQQQYGAQSQQQQ